MNIIRRLFGIGAPAPSERFVTYYVRPKRCDEIVAVRIDRNNDLSEAEDGTFFVRKLARGERCPFPAEVVVSFDKNRREAKVEVQDGQQVDTDTYQAWLNTKE